MHRKAPKRKSQERFEQNNYLARTVAKTLRKPSHVAALWMFWTYADMHGRFEMSAALLGSLLGVTTRAAQKILVEMREDGIIQYAKDKAANGVANKFKLTWQPRNHSSEVERNRPRNHRSRAPEPPFANPGTTVPTNRTDHCVAPAVDAALRRSNATTIEASTA